MRKILKLVEVVDAEKLVSLDIVKSLETVNLMLSYTKGLEMRGITKLISKPDDVRELWIDETGEKTHNLVEGWLDGFRRQVESGSSWFFNSEGWPKEEYAEYRWKHVYERRSDYCYDFSDNLFGGVHVEVHLFHDPYSEMRLDKMVSYEVEGTVPSCLDGAGEKLFGSGVVMITKENEDSWWSELLDGLISAVNRNYGQWNFFNEKGERRIPYIDDLKRCIFPGFERVVKGKEVE